MAAATGVEPGSRRTTLTSGSARLGLAGLAVACAACLRAPPPRTSVVLGPGGRTMTCSVSGPTLTVVENVYGSEVAAVTRPDGGFDVVVVDQVEPCLHVGYSRTWERVGTVLGKCVQREPPRATSNDGSQTYMVRQFKGGDKLSHIAVGYVRYDWAEPVPGIPRETHPVDVWLQMPNTDLHDPGSESNGESAPTLAAFGAAGFFAAWLENDTVLGVPLGASARPAATPLDLAPEAVTDLGPPSVAFTWGGRGLVAFTGSTDGGVHAFATPVTCTY